MCAPVVESEAEERAACERVGHRRARALHAIASRTFISRRHQPIISSLLNGNYAPETSRARAGPRRQPRSPPPLRRARRIWAENSPRRAGAPTEVPRRSKIGRPDAVSARVIRPASSRNYASQSVGNGVEISRKWRRNQSVIASQYQWRTSAIDRCGSGAPRYIPHTPAAERAASASATASCGEIAPRSRLDRVERSRREIAPRSQSQRWHLQMRRAGDQPEPARHRRAEADKPNEGIRPTLDDRRATWKPEVLGGLGG